MVPEPSPDPLSAASGPPNASSLQARCFHPRGHSFTLPALRSCWPLRWADRPGPHPPNGPVASQRPEVRPPAVTLLGGPEPQRSGLTERVGAEEQLPAMPPTPDPGSPGLPEAGSHTSGQDRGRGPGPTSCRPLTCSAQLGTGPWQPGVRGTGCTVPKSQGPRWVLVGVMEPSMTAANFVQRRPLLHPAKG